MEAMPREAVAFEPDTAHDPAIGLDNRTKFEILFAVMLGLFLTALDQTIVGPVLPHIVTDLKGADLYTWVVTAYLLTSTVTIPVYGKLSDLYGRKPLLMIGIGIFLVGSALSGLSQEMWQLILFRAIQGLGAGALFPISLAVVGDLFTPAERGKYQGLFGAVFGIAFLVGPFLGGVLTDNVGWHWIFFVNLPIGIIALAVIARLLPTIRREGARNNIDIPGIATLTLAIVPVLIALTIAENGDWSAPGVDRGLHRRDRLPGALHPRRGAGGGPGRARSSCSGTAPSPCPAWPPSWPASASPWPSSSCRSGSRSSRAPRRPPRATTSCRSSSGSSSARR